jgi:AcrR family transcriptional regulator
MPSRTAPRKRTPRKPRGRARYHHGRLSEALIEATLRLLEEGGPDHVSVREAARRAGVSPGAPFRHFPNRAALLTAVAEQAMARLRAAILAELSRDTSGEPLARLRAIGVAYMRWALHNPTHFQVISTRSLIEFEGSAALVRDNGEIRAVMESLVAEAVRRGQLRPEAARLVPVTGRALVYGLARMAIDGHFPQWDVAEPEVEPTVLAALDLFLAGLSPAIDNNAD